MDIFKFVNPTDPLKMEQGQIIDGLKSKLWVERYLTAGDFKLVADASSDIKSLLPIGSFISHVDTSEIMIVENHEISDVKDRETQIIVSGRGFETYMEQRIVGSNKTFPVSGTPADYSVLAGYVWNQVVTLINNHILLANVVDPADEVPFTQAITSIPGTSVSIDRTFDRRDLYTHILELLAIDNLGLRVVRPGPTNPLGAGSANTALFVHKGVDRSASIVFSYDTGEIVRAEYLWSNKKLKNQALVTGTWVETITTTTEDKYDKRMMYVDASDIDEEYETAPSGGTLTAVVAKMQQRGLEALALQKEVALTKAEISKEAVKAKFRTDFEVGDIITVSGDFNETVPMRISEYVEVEDENGRSGYPTLTTV